MTDDRLVAAIQTMPKTELHVHIEGTLEPELAFEFASRNGVELPWRTLDELKARYTFTDLQDFLNLYYALMKTLVTADDFRDLMLAYLRRAAQDGVRRAEIFFDPQVHLNNGIAYDDVLDGLEAGMRIGRERYGIDGALIMCIVRDLPVASAERMLDIAAPRAAELLGIGLDSAEVGYPPRLFAHVFDRAGELGLHRVAHAGEEGGADYVEEALDLLHAERIDHGAHAVDDPALMRRLADERIAVTRCPLSNLRLNVVDSLEELNIRDFLDANVVTTVNSDDPAYFGGYLCANYLALADIGFSLYELAALGRHSIEAAFLDDAGRTRLEQEFDVWQAEHLG